MALAGRYHGSPKAYETNEMLRGHGMARRPRPSEDVAPSSSAAPSVGPSPPLSPRKANVAGRSSSSLASTRGALRRAPAVVQSTMHRTEGVDTADDVSRALQRMYRRLAREYATEIQQETAKLASKAGPGDGGGPPSAGGDPPKKVKARRGIDEATLARLLTRNKVQEQRQAEKYHKVKERAEEARKHPKRIRVPEKAVVLGRRLHLEAAENHRVVKEKQEELAQQRAAEERAACTFHPTISPYAERLAAREGHYTLEERLEDQPLRDEELQRLRFERAVEEEKACTFQPTLSIGTQEFIAQQRRRRSRTRTSSSRHRRRSAHEPFEPGERLYRDGAERLLRQQIRQQRAVARQQRHVVGGRLRLSAEEAQDVVGRFAAWAAACAERQAVLQEETDRQAHTRSPAAAAAHAMLLHRSPSSRTASTARPNGSPFPSRLDETHEAEERTVTSAQTPTLHSNALSLSQSHRPPTHRGNPTWPSAGAVVSLHTNSTASGSVFSRGGADNGDESERESTLATWSDAAVGAAARKEQLRIRLGALFFKYAVSPTANTVSPHEVRQQVQLYYPEDGGIAAALEAAFSDADQRVSKVDFMAALARYVAQNGPQSWCMPQRLHVQTAHFNHTSASSTAGSAASVRGTFLERLDAPTSSGASSSAKGVEAEHKGAPPSPHACVRSAAMSSSGGAASSNRTPASPAQHIGRAGTSEGVSEAGMRAFATSLAVPPSFSASGDGRDDAKPLRTHIYTRTGGGPAMLPAGHAVERRRMEPEGGLGAGDAEKAIREGHATTSSYAQRPFLVPEALKVMLQRQQQPQPPRRRSSRATSLEQVPAAELVHGYEGHVERHRRSAHQSKSPHDAVDAADVEQRRGAEACTFKPTLNPRSVALSDVNLERRTLYARELQQRRHELQALREAVLQAASKATTNAAVSPPSSRHDGEVTEKAGAVKDGADSSLPAELQTPPSSRRRGLHAHSPGGASPAGAGQSPSIDVSSLSSATAQVNQSGGAPVPVLPEQQPPSESLKLQTAHSVLTEAQEDVGGHVELVAVPLSTPSHFFAQRPTNAVL